MAQLRSCLVGMEARSVAHYWRGEIAKLGHELLFFYFDDEADEPALVRSYVKSSKNDARDAEASCETVARRPMRFAAVKSQGQQDLLALHRIRSLPIREHTSLMNQMRGLLAECGIVVALGAVHLRRAVAEIRKIAMRERAAA